MTSPIIDFIAARLNEDEAAAQAAIDPDRPGTHWQWVNDETDEPIGDMDKESASSGLSLRTVEEFGETRKIGSTTIGPLPAFVIYTAEDIIPGAGDHIARHDPARVLREVQAKRAILERESAVTLPEWKPDCGGDWVLSGDGFFANYWPDNTVSASITDGFDGPTLADSGIVSKDSRASCQAFAESWVREHLPQRSPVLRALAAIYSDHPDHRKEWAA